MKFVYAVLITVLCCSAAAQGQPTAKVTSSVSTYTSSGGTVTFDVVITSPSSLAALGVTIGKVPAGWLFAGVSGKNIPQVVPENNGTDKFDFAYTNVPASPISFSFSATYPAGLSGDQVFSGCAAIVRPSSSPTIPIADIILTPASTSGQPTAPSILIQPTGVTIDAGQSASFTVSATGTAPLTYQWRKDGVAIGGATSATYAIVSATTASAGSYSVVVTNAAGSVVSSAAALTIRPPANAPTISFQPVGATVSQGQNVNFIVVAGGTAPLLYQWKKDGADLNGATSATLALTGVTTASAGSYSVVVTNAAGAVTSAAAVLVVNGAVTATPPSITTQPASQSVGVGASASFAVVATGSGLLSYQWRKDGTAIGGATGATLSLNSVEAGTAGDYTVVVTNSTGSTTSAIAKLTVTPAAGGNMAGAYFGTLGGSSGKFAFLVHPGNNAEFLGGTGDTFLMARDVVIDASGRFRFTATSLVPPARGTAGHAIAAAGSEYIVEGAISTSTGGLSATVSGLNARLEAGRAAATGSTTLLAGFYRQAVAGQSAIGYTIVGAAGDIYLVNIADGVADAGRGRVDSTGTVEVLTDRNARVSGAITAASATIVLTVAPASGTTLTFVGANAARIEVEKLINISTRSQINTGGSGLITGFVVSGDQPKRVLIRAIGPSLDGFGVSGALSAAHLEVFSNSGRAAAGDDWGKGTDPAAIASAAARVGAFSLSNNSRDAALLLDLAPGAYTAIVTGQGGVGGVSLVEVYDAAESSAPPTQRIINLSTRGFAGGGDGTLIAGFVVSGTVPKRVLVRGIGPALSAFGVTGVLARPRVSVFARDTLVAQNSGWTASSDAQLISQASTQVGAFALAEGADSALIVNLAPGAYTAQVSGVADGTGVALVEIYEIP